MIDRLIRFVFYVVVACLVGFVLTALVNFAPIIPGELKNLLNIVIWAVVILAIAWSAYVTFRPALPPDSTP
jgi:hypothetical protein